MPRSMVRWLVAGMLVAGLVGTAQVGTQLAPPAVRMADAARRFLDTLTAEQRQVVQFPFDSVERTAWAFVPLQDRQRQPTRKGLRLELMNDTQKQAALGLLKAGLSAKGYERASAIMELEAVLAEQEKDRGPVRHPGWYFFTVFGTPGQGSWGWRVDGHHLSLNFTMTGERVVCVTPAFFGSNPGEVKAGEKQGIRPLAGTHDRAVELIESLTPAQRTLALVPRFGEVQGMTAAAKIGKPVGLAYPQLQPEQQGFLRNLLGVYLENFAKDLAAAERKRLEAAGWDQLHFAFSGSTTAGEAMTYRLQGPNLLVEFLNVQPDGAGNKNNHYHTSWRTLPADFGK